MKLLLYFPSAELAEWRTAFAAALPEADVRIWSPGLDWRADYAALWGAPSELFLGQPQLKAVFNLAAGVESLLTNDALAASIPIIRLEDAGMGRQMVEYVSWAVVRYFRRFDDYTMQQSHSEWRERRTRSRAEFPIGVMGLGVLGAQAARAFVSLGFPVVGWSRTAKRIDGVLCHAGAAALERFLAGSRALVCMLPHTPETHGLLDRATLEKLPKGAYVINVGRGALIVDVDLLALLDAGHIAGATLDVFNEEPLPPEHPYWRHPRVVVTPHISGATLVDESVAQVADKLRRLERGESVSGMVDRARGY
jgi:glyoxylate/hydroxypyruvate reductase A